MQTSQPWSARLYFLLRKPKSCCSCLIQHMVGPHSLAFAALPLPRVVVPFVHCSLSSGTAVHPSLLLLLLLLLLLQLKTCVHPQTLSHLHPHTLFLCLACCVRFFFVLSVPLTRGHGKKLRKVAQLCLEETSTQELVSALIAGVGGPAHARRSAHTHMCSHLPAHAYTHIHAHILAHTHALSLSLSLSLFSGLQDRINISSQQQQEREDATRGQFPSQQDPPGAASFLLFCFFVAERFNRHRCMPWQCVLSVQCTHVRTPALFSFSPCLCVSTPTFSLSTSLSRVFSLDRSVPDLTAHASAAAFV